MSYRCQDCETAYPNETHPQEMSPNRVVIATRQREEGRGRGTEIAQEKNLCKACLHKHEARNA